MQGTQKCSLGLGQEHRPCSRHQSTGETGLSVNIMPGVPGRGGGVAGVLGGMTIGGLGGVGTTWGGRTNTTGALVVWPTPHSSSDSSELSTQFDDPSHLSF